MTEITIVLPYEHVEDFCLHWASAESEIDFRENLFEAERCTMSFAASELKGYINKINFEFKVAYANLCPQKAKSIKLKIEHKDNVGGYRWIPDDNGLTIVGFGRNGLLDGVYDFLRLQGCRWFSPGDKGECIPAATELKWPEKETQLIPSFKYRCIDAFPKSNDSYMCTLWMARNHLNVCFRKANNGKLADKLGMLSRQGGHLFHRIFKADRVLDNGKTMWEEHNEWYGMPKDGIKDEKTPFKVQLCVSNSELQQFVSEDILKLLNGEMSDVDIIDAWWFDGCNENCCCENCADLGNGSDHNLLLMSAIREYLDKAFAAGRLNRKVLLDTLAYRDTFQGPTTTMPENLKKAGDICIFYPIRRCYKHKINNSGCEFNKVHNNSLQSWKPQEKALSFWVGEYYNVSNYCDLPLLFMDTVPDDMRYYHKMGCEGITYMHGSPANWAVRSLTQLQHTQYAWNIKTDDKTLLDDYFSHRYRQHAREARKAYGYVKEASMEMAVWRAGEIGLSLWEWDGTLPDKELMFGHYNNSEQSIKAVEHCALLYQGAVDIFKCLIKKDQVDSWENFPNRAQQKEPETPDELARFIDSGKLEYRLEEDLRSLIYGLDTARLTAAVLNYHYQLFKRNIENADKYWDNIESVAAEMSAYYLPWWYDKLYGMRGIDAFSATHWRQDIARFRGARISKKIIKIMS